MQEPDFKEVAAQLRQPTGADGVKTAGYMGMNNRHMIEQAINYLELTNDDKILETGYGGGLHLGYLFEKAPLACYKGVDISATMRDTAIANNAAIKGDFEFIQQDVTNGYLAIPQFPDESFDKIFTLNTLYFWDDAAAQATELLRLLKPDGRLVVGFGARDFMESLPFTQYGFKLYNVSDAETLLTNVGFKIVDTHTEREFVPGVQGEVVERDIIFICATR